MERAHFKKCKVVMLSTNEKANIGADNCYLPNTKTLIIDNFKSHLYILSDEKIKDGDWCINLAHKLVVQSTDSEWSNSNSDNLKKIITTTDKLNINPNVADSYRTSNCLPQPSQSFVEKFVEEYNKGNVITEVMVEYESYCVYGDDCPSKGSFDKQHLCKVDYKLKINPKDNTITIKKVKDSWSNRERIKFAIDFANHCLKQVGINNIQTLGEMMKFEEKWIEENL